MITADICERALIIGAFSAYREAKRYEIAEIIGELCAAYHVKARSGAYFFLLRLAISAYDAMSEYPREIAHQGAA